MTGWEECIIDMDRVNIGNVEAFNNRIFYVCIPMSIIISTQCQIFYRFFYFGQSSLDAQRSQR
jgi:hypothetical protein